MGGAETLYAIRAIAPKVTVVLVSTVELIGYSSSAFSRKMPPLYST